MGREPNVMNFYPLLANDLYGKKGGLMQDFGG